MDTVIPRACLVPGHLPKEEHLQLWRQSIAPMLDSTPVHGPEAGRILPQISQYHLGRFLFIDCAFPGQHYRRDSGLMARHDDADHLSLQMLVHGYNRVVNGTTSFAMKPGSVCGVNLAYEVKAQSDDSEVVMLLLPRQLLLDELPQLAGLRGPAFADGSVCGRIFMDYMLSLRRHLPQTKADSVPALTQSMLGMLDSLILHGDAGAPEAQTAMFAAICRHIDANLDDPHLAADTLCGQFHCSRATLYRLFKPHGGVREHIRRRRLMACFKAISSPRQHHRRVFDVALDFGFVSPSHFSHLFRSHFGMSPSEARDAACRHVGRPPTLAMPSGGSAAEDVECMWRWAKSLTASAALGGGA